MNELVCFHVLQVGCAAWLHVCLVQEKKREREKKRLFI